MELTIAIEQEFQLDISMLDNLPPEDAFRSMDSFGHFQEAQSRPPFKDQASEGLVDMSLCGLKVQVPRSGRDPSQAWPQ